MIKINRAVQLSFPFMTNQGNKRPVASPPQPEQRRDASSAMVQGYGCHQKITGRPCHEGSDEVIGRGPSPFCFRSVLKFRHEGARGFGLGRFRLGAQDRSCLRQCFVQNPGKAGDDYAFRSRPLQCGYAGIACRAAGQDIVHQYDLRAAQPFTMTRIGDDGS